MSEIQQYDDGELVAALQFYIKGPKENRQLVALVRETCRVLANRPTDGTMSVALVDRVLDQAYEWLGERE